MLVKEKGDGIIRALRDNRLSFRAKGLLAYLDKCPEFLDVGLGDIVADGTDKEGSIRSAIRECEEAGYLSAERTRDERGRMGTYRFTLKV